MRARPGAVIVVFLRELGARRRDRNSLFSRAKMIIFYTIIPVCLRAPAFSDNDRKEQPGVGPSKFAGLVLKLFRSRKPSERIGRPGWCRPELFRPSDRDHFIKAGCKANCAPGTRYLSCLPYIRRPSRPVAGESRNSTMLFAFRLIACLSRACHRHQPHQRSRSAGDVVFMTFVRPTTTSFGPMSNRR